MGGLYGSGIYAGKIRVRFRVLSVLTTKFIALLRALLQQPDLGFAKIGPHHGQRGLLFRSKGHLLVWQLFRNFDFASSLSLLISLGIWLSFYTKILRSFCINC